MAHMILNELKEMHKRYLLEDDDDVDRASGERRETIMRSV